MLSSRQRLCALMGAVFLCGVYHSTLQAVEQLSFNRDVRPILSDRCYACHGPDKDDRKADLRLDTREGAMRDLGGYAAVVPGQPDKSELVARIETSDEDDIMPPIDSHLSLSKEEKAILKRWITEGAKWEGHWAFQQIKRPQPPPKRLGLGWGNNAIDALVLKEFKERGVKPSKETDRASWLRRVSQDITGLPPSVEQLDAFLADKSKEAYHTVVNRLLKSDDYAERMALIWMDNARYADSNGYQFDNERTMWPWRDWVIAAFQQNMPYDQFVTEQLAGDLLDKPTQDQVIATGFNRNHGYSIEGGIIDEEYRVTYANDKTTTFGTLFLGLTFECTRCHDHKYDPLSMKDYYSLYAFFDSSSEVGAPGEKGRKQKAAAPFVEIKAENAKPKSPPVRAMVMKEKERQSFILNQGLFDQQGVNVQPDTPDALPEFQGYRADRLGLAQWLTDEKNPLFARVVMNRLWQQFFGVGIVKTSDNFGLQGELPSHPELLDWLASEFQDSDWDLHHMITLIVLSDTYRQKSRFRPEHDDPENRLLARGPSFRLSGELIRDQALAVSGLLNRKMGGPSVKPYQPNGVWEDLNASKSHEEKYVQSKGDDLYRKSLYTYWRRAVPHPAMLAFDAPSRDVCVVKREITNTPLQAFVTLHAPIFLEASVMTAIDAMEKDDALVYMFRKTLSREPTSTDMQKLKTYHDARHAYYAEDQNRSAKLMAMAGGHLAEKNVDVVNVAALADVAHLIFNLSETLTRK